MAKTTTADLAVGLLDACHTRELFDFGLWPQQRQLLAKVEEGPRLHVWALGRRSGKTTMAALVCLWDALLSPELSRNVRPGERRYTVAVATNLRQARLIVQAARSIVTGSPLLAAHVVSKTDDEIAFDTGATLAAFPCTSRGGRGWPISTLVMDEAAHFVDTDGNSAAEQVWRALVPSCAQFADRARIIVSSTPYGADGFFADLHAKAAAGELEDAIAQHATSAEMNPTLDPSFLRRELERDPDGFAGEYEARFVGSGGAFLDAERIRDAVEQRGELDPSQADEWVAGLDPAFSSDPFGLAIVGRQPVRFAEVDRLVLGLARAWAPARTVSFDERRGHEDEVLREVADTCLRYRVSEVVTDQYAARAIVDYFERRGLQVRTVAMSAASKTEVYAELRARLHTGALELYEHEGLLQELRRLRTRYTAGSASVVNPRVGGSHGDLAQALAMAVHAQAGSGGNLQGGFVPADPRDVERGTLAEMYFGDERAGLPRLTPGMRL